MNGLNAKVRFLPRKLSLDIVDLSKMSSLFEGILEEDLTVKHHHKKGADIHITHKIESVHFGDVMLISPNPIEFYLFGANLCLLQLRDLKVSGLKDEGSARGYIFWQISMLMYAYSGLEALVNSKIPNDISFVKDGKTMTKADIERNLSIGEKIKEVLLIRVGDLHYWSNIKYLINLRHSVVHLKTFVDNKQEFQSYEEIYKKLIEYDFEEGLKFVKQLITVIY